MKKNTPTHYVDTSVFIEALTSPRKEQGRQCYRYLRRLGKIFVWVLSAPVMYEFYYFALQKQKDASDEFHDFLWYFYQDRGPIVLSPETGLNNLGYVQNLDKRLSHLDSLHLASAVGNAHVFVTIDKEILDNEALKKLGFKILHPSSFL